MNIMGIPLGSVNQTEVIDRRFDTFSNATTYAMHIDSVGDGTGTAGIYDSIYTVTSGVSSYALDAPSLTVNIPAGASVEGLQYHLHRLTAQHSDATVNFTFTGTGVRVYQIWLMRNLLTIPQDTCRIEYNSIDRGTTRLSANRRNNYIPPLDGTPDKWAINASVEFYRNPAEKAAADTLIHIIRNNKTFTMFPDPSTHPQIAFVGIWPNTISQMRYMSRVKSVGRRVIFFAEEQ